ncbi:MAG: lipid-A-disaccharide synthase [Henriciella sp.]
MPRIFFVAAETSGDLLAAEIIDEIRSVQPDAVIQGIGADEMAHRGVKSAIDVSELSVVGLIEGVKIYKRVVELADLAAQDIIDFKPDVVALVDSWGFTLRVAQRVRARAPGIKLVKVVGPQVWATRPGRAKTLAQSVDHLVCIHAMEGPFYEPYGLPVTVMGNPALSRGHKGDRLAGRTQLGLSAEEELLLVLPGSRRSEIAAVAPELVATAKAVKAARQQTRIVFAPAPGVRAVFAEAFPDIESWAQMAPANADRFDTMAAADYVLACSGTVTSELAMQSVPFLVGYKTGWMTWALARFFLFKPIHITLLNIAADDQQIVPEFVQTKFRAEAMADEALGMLGDPSARKQQIAAQEKALARMGEGQGNSARIAAEAILDQI